MGSCKSKPAAPAGKRASKKKKEDSDVAELHTKLRKRGKNVFAEPIDKDWKPVIYEKSLVSKEIIRDALKGNNFSALFEEMKESELTRFVDLMFPETQSAGKTIIAQGSSGEFMYVLEKGHVIFKVNGNTVGEAKDRSSFGELALLYGSPRAADVVAVTECVLWKIDRTSFRACMAYTARLVEKKQGAASFGRSGPEHSAQEWPSRLDVKFSSLQVIANLGSGQFGIVKLVQGADDSVYVLKAVSKKKIEDQGAQDAILQEKRTMIACNHPFVCKLYATFRDAANIYFMMDFAQGGDLFALLDSEGGRLKSEHVRFYAAGVVMALGHLHSKGIVYRDLKPENLMIDEKGYIKLIDFGFAKFMNSSKTYTLCGTPEYMAPEIILGRGYGISVDWWAAGVLVYEMTVGYSPFSDPEGDGDPAEVWGDIIKGRLNFNPKEWKGSGAMPLVKVLLTQNEKKRLGSTGGGEDAVKKHRYFKAVDWAKLFNFQRKAPWVPPLRNAIDTTHFDDIEFDEEPVDRNLKLSTAWDLEFGESTDGQDGSDGDDGNPFAAFLSIFSGNKI